MFAAFFEIHRLEIQGFKADSAKMHKLFLIQTLLSVSIAGYFALTGDLPAAIAAVYGGGIALVNAFLAWRRIAKAQKMLVQDGKAIVRSFYIGAIERFVFALVAMAAGVIKKFRVPSFGKG